MKVRNIKLTIEYDGTNYHGWQSQNNALAIQDIITDALKEITKQDIKINGSGRTDAGVHALGQVANFHTNSTIPIDKFPVALNSILPNDIVIVDAEEVLPGFHARYSCKGKTYKYLILNSPIPSALMRNRAAHISYELDIEAMQQACKLIIGTRDFSSFCGAGSSVKDFTRTVIFADITQDGDIIEFVISGNGFLKNMVRIIVGTLIDVGREKITLEQLESIIKSKNRENAGITMPPQGLYLEEVFYNEAKSRL